MNRIPSRAAVRAGWVIVFLAIAAVLVALGTIPAGATTPYRVAGHRGATGVAGYPEQSLKAVGYTATYGGQIVEGDVRFTADNYAVMAHDDKVPGCTGTISGQTFAQLRTCAPHTVLPQLLFWLREAKRLGLVANVELKGQPTEHQMEVFRRTVVNEGPDVVVVASFYPDVLDTVARVLGYRVQGAPIIARTGSLFGYSVAEHAAKYRIVMPDYRGVDVGKVRAYQAAGVEVWLWTVVDQAKDDGWSLRRSRALLGIAGGVIIADDVRKVNHG